MKKYSTPDMYVFLVSKDEIMFDIIDKSGNVTDGEGDDIYNPTLSGGGTGNNPISGGI